MPSFATPRLTLRSATRSLAITLWPGLAMVSATAAGVCEVRSTPERTPVIELYTSEGCSSCPPADTWLSTLKGRPVVAQAFHVVYWDYIGWKDRFAQPLFTERQKDVARRNGLRGIYTPQVVVNGRDWRNWQGQARLPGGDTPALASIELRRTSASDGFEALIRPADASRPWTATVTVTEGGHASRVSAGENAGATLQHDFIVRQLTPLGQYRGSQSVRFAAVAAQPGHLRRINLVVNDGSGGEPLQAVSMACP